MRSWGNRADDLDVGKLGLIVVALALLATARCYNADIVGAMAGMPVVGSMVPR